MEKKAMAVPTLRAPRAEDRYDRQGGQQPGEGKKDVGYPHDDGVGRVCDVAGHEPQHDAEGGAGACGDDGDAD
jgi:hypothetical protein